MPENDAMCRFVFERMSEQVHFWKLVRDESGEIQTWRLADINPAALAGWGRTREETVGKTADEIFPGATAHFMPFVREIFTEGAAPSSESFFPGSNQHFKMTRLPSGECFITTAVDTAGYKQTEMDAKTISSLRQYAEEAARKVQDARLPEYSAPLSNEEVRLALHELHVHEIELETQNEELRAAQTELETARARYFDLYHLAPVGYCTLSEQGMILEANLTAANLLGVSRAALLKQPLSKFILKEDQDVFYLHRKNLLETGEPGACELRMRKNDGAEFWTLLKATVAKGPDGTVCFVVMSDITERKQAEEALARTRNTLEEAQKIAHLGCFEYDASTRTTTWSGEEYHIYGMDPAGPSPEYDVMLQNCIHPDDRAMLHETFTEAMRNRKVYELEHRVVRPGGGVRWVYDRAFPYFNEQGELVRYIGTTLDITGRKEAEEALRESAQREHERTTELQTILDTMPIPVFITRDPEAREMVGNPASWAALQVPAEANLSKSAEPDKRPGNFRVMRDGVEIPPDELPIQQAARGIEARDTGFTIELANGEQRHYFGNATPLRDEQGRVRGSVGAFADITPLKKVEEALRESEGRFKDMFSQAPLGIAIVDSLNARFYLVNSAMERITGRSAEELQRIDWVSITHPDDIQPDIDMMAAMNAGKIPGFQLEKRYLHPDGHYFWVNITVAPLYVQDKTKPRHLLMVNDISEHKRMEKEYLDVARQWQVTFDAVSDAIFLLDTDKRVLRYNAAAAKLFGKSGGEIAGRHCCDVIHNRPIALPECPIDRMKISRQRESMEIDVAGSCYQVTVDPLMDADGTLHGAVQIISDITERKRVEVALKESEEKFRLFMDHSPTIAWIRDQEGRFVFLSGNYIRLFGLENTDWFGKTNLDLFPAEVLDEFRKHDLAVMKSGIPIEKVEQVPGLDGAPRYWLTNKFPFRDAAGNRYVAGISLDITERKLAEEALSESEKRFQAIVTHTPDHMVFQDAELRYTEVVNPQLGLTREEMIGKTDYDILNRKDAELVTQAKRKVIETGETIFFAPKLASKTGEMEYFEGSFMPKTGQDGRTNGVIGFFRNVTAQKQAEEALLRSFDQINLLINNLPGYAFFKDTNLRYVMLNDRACHLIGKPLEDIIGKDDFDLFPAEYAERFTKDDRLVLASGKPLLVDNEVNEEDGKTVILSTRKVPIQDASGRVTGLIGLSIDITARKHAEEALRESEERLRHTLQASATGTFEVNFQTGENRWNEVEYELLGLKPGDVPPGPASFFQYVHPDDIGELTARWEDASRTGHLDAEFRIIRADGQERWLAGKGRFFYQDNLGAASPEGGQQAVQFLGVNFDITERKLAEEALAAAHRQTQAIIDNTTALVYAFDLEERFVMANTTLAELLNTTPDRLIGKRRHDFMAQTDADWHEANDRKVIEAGRAMEFEERSELQDRSITWLTTKFPMRDAEGRIYAVAGFSADISERKRMEEALHESEERLQAIVTHTPDYISIQDANLRYVEVVNPQLGKTREEVIGKTEYELVNREEAEYLTQNKRKVLETGETLCLMLSLTSKTGKREYFEGSYLPKTGRDGQVNGVIGFFRNVTAQKQAEEALRESEEKYRAILHTNMDGFLRVDLTGRLLEVNENFCRMTGYEERELLAMRISDIDAVRTEEEVREQLLVIKEIGEARFERQHRRKNGETYPAEINIQYKPWRGGELVIFAKDITERKRAEEIVRECERNVLKMRKSESLGRMAGAIAHHFNNHMFAVLGNLELALEDMPPGSRVYDEILAAMNSAHRAAEIGGMMRQYMGQGTKKKEMLDLSKVCELSLPMLRAALPADVKLVDKLCESGPGIRGNALQIQQVLSSLVVNAGEALGLTMGGVVELTVKTASAVDIPLKHRFPMDWRPVDKHYACVEVRDEGCGIPEEDFDNIFDPFFSRKFTGRGLGLPVLLGIVRAHGGCVTLKSEVGRGSVFQVYLPALPETNGTKKKQRLTLAENETGGVSVSKGTVLLVDDAKDVLEMGRNMLTRLGYKVLAARDGAEGLEMFRQSPEQIRLVISDIVMPRMDGWELLETIRKINPEIPVILSSGYDRAEALSGEHAEMPQGFLAKPYMSQELLEAIREALH